MYECFRRILSSFTEAQESKQPKINKNTNNIKIKIKRNEKLRKYYLSDAVTWPASGCGFQPIEVSGIDGNGDSGDIKTDTVNLQNRLASHVFVALLLLLGLLCKSV